VRAVSFPLTLAACVALAQAPAPIPDVVRIGPGVKTPKLLSKIEPEYSPMARAEGIEGMVLLDVIVDEHGRATNISVISPLGFGLDERAQAAIEKWVFQPGEKDGRPVKIQATIEVKFRFLDSNFDFRIEERRTSFNAILQSLRRHDGTPSVHQLQTIEKLCQKNYPPALYLKSVLMDQGKLPSNDAAESLRLLTKAAEKHYGPAMYEIGRKYVAGKELPKDVQKGLAMMRDAAVLGSTAAQHSLGSRYQVGDEVPPDPDRACRYFRLCAATNDPRCQYKLAQLLLDRPGRKERDYVQAVAWLQLAAKQRYALAVTLLDRERPHLTAEQLDWVNKLTPQLVQPR
jgi:TonB family protein